MEGDMLFISWFLFLVSLHSRPRLHNIPHTSSFHILLKIYYALPIFISIFLSSFFNFILLVKDVRRYFKMFMCFQLFPFVLMMQTCHLKEQGREHYTERNRKESFWHNMEGHVGEEGSEQRKQASKWRLWFYTLIYQLKIPTKCFYFNRLRWILLRENVAGCVIWYFLI